MNDRTGQAVTDKAVKGIRYEQLPALCESCGWPALCRVCGKKISGLERAGERWPELKDGRLCELCWRGARDLYRLGTCHLCGGTYFCKQVVGGLVCVVCYTGQEEPPPELERYGRCECGRLERLQIADRVGERYLCVQCQNTEQMTT